MAHWVNESEMERESDTFLERNNYDISTCEITVNFFVCFTFLLNESKAHTYRSVRGERILLFHIRQITMYVSRFIKLIFRNY